ncbi:MAG: hypothetical protein H0V66_07430 [Bdellovibrionales bacterium]|nr:hypothetical protein [Bdellovibrionales bacterium]
MDFCSNRVLGKHYFKDNADTLALSNWHETEDNGLVLPRINITLTMIRNILINQMYTELTIIAPILVQWAKEGYKPDRERLVRLINSLNGPLGVLNTHGGAFCFIEEFLSPEVIEVVKAAYGEQIGMFEEISLNMYHGIIDEVESLYTDTMEIDFNNKSEIYDHVTDLSSNYLYQLITEFYDHVVGHIMNVREVLKILTKDDRTGIEMLDKDIEQKVGGMFYKQLFVKHGNILYVEHFKNIFDLIKAYKEVVGSDCTDFPAELPWVTKAA